MSSRCVTPFYRRNDITTEWMALPCGKCPGCMKRRTSGWSFRLVKEGERSETALFVTLTYDSKYVPITKKGFMSLNKADVQKFMKRLRKLSERNLKYYACGEYGSKRDRPHYHLIIFNADPEKVEKAWSLENKSLGQIYIGTVNEASIGYTLKYMSKPGTIPRHRNDDRQKEFSLMSKGLGSNYLSEKMIFWHKSDLINRVYVPIIEGKKIAMPRYYKDKIYNQMDKILITNHMKKTILEEDEKTRELLIKEFGDMAGKVQSERIQNQFNKMYKNSQLGRDKI